MAGEKLREVQAAAKQQQALASGLIKAGELAYICRPLAYVIALRMWGSLSCMLLTKQFQRLLSVHDYACACLVCYLSVPALSGSYLESALAGEQSSGKTLLACLSPSSAA